MNVFLLCTVRKPELLPAATLVFDTIRVGFPTATICAVLNHLEDDPREIIKDKVTSVRPSNIISLINQVTHWDFIRRLVENEQSPFVICDTDMIFWSSVEDWKFDAPLAGRLMPTFNEEFTKAVYMPRLHTSLLFVDPARVRAKIADYYATIPDSWFTHRPDLFDTQFVPTPQGNLFFDTCAMLYSAIGGQAFSEAQLDCYDHLHGACSVDIVNSSWGDGKTQEWHQKVYANPELARGTWRAHDKFFAERAA